MKSILAAFVLLASMSSYALTEKTTRIDCTDYSNSDMQLSITQGEDSRIIGISLYNIDWSQTAEGTMQTNIAIGSKNPMAGYSVILLNDGQTVDIDYSILEKVTKVK
ncbi:MAG: hypothetical protein H7256_08655 [Bdellovibrio sp.]|nr:hypothetical protein [Bdellovibrio sp.]